MRAEDDIIIDETEEPASPALAKSDVEEDTPDEKLLPRGCDRNADGSVTVKFDFPVTLSIRSGGDVRQERFDKLTFRRLTGADLNAFMSVAKEHQQVTLFTRSARIKAATMKVLFDKMDGADIKRCGLVLDTFF